jgi:hypothetical protein
MQDPFDELSLDSEAMDDCGCGGQFGSFEGDTLPPPEEMEAALEECMSAGATADSELDLALDDDLLLAEDELALPDLAGAEGVDLKSLIALAEQYPGLKISLSFG